MNERKKMCFDCLHCKVSKLSVSEPIGRIDKALTRPAVSVKSTKKNRFCFCEKTKKRKPHTDNFWIKKEVCKHFDDMNEDIRKPLLRLTVFARAANG
jgi:hypothetical protein